MSRAIILCVWIEPEWNWNIWIKPFAQLTDKFESNQSGIETNCPVPKLFHFIQVWIEPEWNWNEINWQIRNSFWHTFESNQSGIETNCRFPWAEALCRLNRTRVELKRDVLENRLVWSSRFESNQSGIETFTCVLKRLLWCRLNRTRVELKHGFRLIVSNKYKGVWIEPEWNWNFIISPTLSYLSHRLNRTRVELKRRWLQWLTYLMVRFESNQSGIETFLSDRKLSRFCLFESNQSGIETNNYSSW